MPSPRPAPEAAAPARAVPAPRLPGLDLLRALAIAWVMIYHAATFDLFPDGFWLADFGWLGVDLFFVLSGFLIAGQLLRPWARGSRPDYRRFFGRRLLRTLPAYLVVVAVYFAVPALRDRDSIQPLWRFLTFTQNFDLHPPQSFSQAWSLCVEEQFYLALPAVVALIALRPSAAKIVATLLALLILGAVLRGYVWLRDVAGTPFDLTAPAAHGRTYMTLIYYPTWMRLDGLLAGVTAALVQSFRPELWRLAMARGNLLLIAGLAGVGLGMAFFGDQVAGFWPAVLGYPLMAFAMALVVAAASGPQTRIGRYAVPGAKALATGAYSLYLSHKIVFHAVAAASGRLPLWAHALRLPLALLGALILGAALYALVERPFLKLRDRLDGPSRSSIAETKPATGQPA